MAVPEKQLRIPGPTPIPERVRSVASRQMINHRGTEFTSLLNEILAGLQTVLRTGNDVLLFPCSGTGGLEAAVVNILSPGEQALFCVCGSFGKRWADIAEAFGARPVRLDAPSGQPITAGAVADALAANPAVRSVWVTHNETSTGVTNDLVSIARVVKESGRLLCVDSVSGAGCIPLDVDRDRLDVVVTGSQKGWLSPPGLSMIAVSAEAFEAASRSTLPRWYFDFAREKSFQDKGQTCITPPLSVMYAMHEGLRVIQEEGVEETLARHHRIAGRIRDGVQSLGLELLADEDARSDTVTAVRNPTADADTLKAFTKTLRDVHGVEVAGGQGDLQGKIFRIGHLGWIEDSDAESILEALAATMQDLTILPAAQVAG